MSRIICIVVFIVLSHGQTIAQIDWLGRLGLQVEFGTHVQRLGLMYQLYVYNQSGQLTQGTYVRYNFRNLGPRGGYFELKLQLGLQAQWGGNQMDKFAFNELSNVSPHDYHLGYSFNLYLDGKELSQTTGSVHAGIKEFVLAIDNDAFGTNPVHDKFRTGAVYFGYQMDSLLLGIQSTLWTGMSYKAPKVKDSDYPAKKGYRDPSDVPYGAYSHGVLAARAEYAWNYGQSFRLEAGIDSEKIRNVIQNKMIHDLMPDRWIGYENPHYPMLQENGAPFLFEAGTAVKKNKPYLQFALNPAVFY